MLISEINPQEALNYAKRFMTELGYEEPEADSFPADHDKVVAVGIAALSDIPPLARGDHVLAMRRRAGGNLSKEKMQEMARYYKISASRLYSNATTAENFPIHYRPISVHIGYSHLEVLNGMTDDHKEELLDKAEELQWTVEQLTDEASRLKSWKETAVADEFTSAIDDTIPENNLGGIALSPDETIEEKAERAAGDADAYSWSGEQELDDRRGFSLAMEPIAAAEQIAMLVRTGEINEGWVATFVAHLTELVGK